MSIKLKYFLKLFLISGLGFSIISTLGDAFFRDELFSFSSFIFKGLFFGLFMALFFTSYHFYELKHLGISNITDEDLKPKQSRFVPSELSIDNIKENIKSLAPEFNLIQSNEQSILLKRNISLKSWGENIIIESSSQGNDQGYMISSKPIYFQLVDSGSGLANVLKIQKIISINSKASLS